MSVFTISNRFLDPYDPFWICRILSLKMGTVAILLFLGNAFLLNPPSSVAYILTTLVGATAAEMLPTNSKLKKIGAFFSIILILAIPSILFGWFSYLRQWLFLFVFVFTYIAFRFMVKNPKSAVIPVMMVTWGVMQLAGGASTDLIGVMNDIFYYAGYALVGALGVIFFPNFTPNIFKSAFIRILENNIQKIGSKDHKNSDAMVLSSLSMMRSTLSLLPDSYTLLHELIVQFQSECTQQNFLNEEDQRLVKTILTSLTYAVSHQIKFSDSGDHLAQLSARNQHAFAPLSRMIEGYDQCLA